MSPKPNKTTPTWNCIGLYTIVNKTRDMHIRLPFVCFAHTQFNIVVRTSKIHLTLECQVVVFATFQSGFCNGNFFNHWSLGVFLFHGVVAFGCYTLDLNTWSFELCFCVAFFKASGSWKSSISSQTLESRIFILLFATFNGPSRV